MSSLALGLAVLALCWCTGLTLAVSRRNPSSGRHRGEFRDGAER